MSIGNRRDKEMQDLLNEFNVERGGMSGGAAAIVTHKNRAVGGSI